MAEDLIDSLFGIGPQVRYVAVAEGQEVVLRERAELAAASSGDSDRYEELLVNPALLVLTRRRGEIDCGGLEYVIVRYGNFFQIVAPHGAGHVSVAVEPDADVVAVAREVVGRLPG
jgi:hypothetical protein